jgi:hypothetical protein
MKYQRFLIATHFASENKFFDSFIKNVDTSKIERIKLLMQSCVRLNFNTVHVTSLGY